MAIHVFDLDGTLTRRDTFVPFLLGYMLGNPRTLMSAPALAIAVMLYYTGHIDNSELKRRFIHTLLAGKSKAELALWGERYAGRVMKSEIRGDALRELHDIQSSGHVVVLATASIDLYVQPLAAKLGITNTLCTRLEYSAEGDITGRLMEGNCYGENKLRQFESWRASCKSPGPVHMYSDHHADLPLLEQADNAFVVNPGRRLTRLSAARGFEIKHWR